VGGCVEGREAAGEMKISRIIQQDTRAGIALALCTNGRYAIVEIFLDGRRRFKPYKSLAVAKAHFARATSRRP
jgi:hypothetical protein